MGIIMALAFLLIAGTAAAAPVTLRDVSTNEPITNGIVYLSSGNQRSNEYITGPVEIPAGDGELTILFDELLTRGADYYRAVQLREVRDELLLFPVGTVRGDVKDSRNNLVGGARLRFDCGGGQFAFPEATDAFGGFSVQAMPVGACTITARYKDAVGSAEVQVERGSLVTAEIKLDKTVISERKRGRLATAGILAALFFGGAAAGYAVFMLARRMRRRDARDEGVGVAVPQARESEGQEVGAKKASLSSRTEDILKTLNGKEKEIVRFLLEHGNQSPQSTVRHQTGIPRTSLSRVLQSLETKKIITLKKLGKMVRIALTDWFLGKEE